MSNNYSNFLLKMRPCSKIPKNGGVYPSGSVYGLRMCSPYVARIVFSNFRSYVPSEYRILSPWYATGILFTLFIKFQGIISLFSRISGYTFEGRGTFAQVQVQNCRTPTLPYCILRTSLRGTRVTGSNIFERTPDINKLKGCSES